MSNALDKLKALWRVLKSSVSPAFIMLMCASFIMWYILKLQYTYTTDYAGLVNIEGERMRIPCVIEGKGTNLLGYRVHMHKEIKIALIDLKYSIASEQDEQTGEVVDSIVIDPHSIQSALSVRFSDIKVVSVGDVPQLSMTNLQSAKGK